MVLTNHANTVQVSLPQTNMRRLTASQIKNWLERLATYTAGLLAGSSCPVCGVRAIIVGGRVLWPALVAEWGLSPTWTRYFDNREGLKCGCCRASLRSRHLAHGILAASRDIARAEASSLKDLCSDTRFKALSVAEINAAGNLHRFMAKLPKLRYSEYESTVPEVPSEDLMALSYHNSSFDIVITSDTLEHVPDVHIALGEIYRVLKPGGMHVFTVPVVWNRQETRKRASLNERQIVHHLPPSYHGNASKSAADRLVFYEFGSDFVNICTRNGFDVRLLTDSENPALVTFLARKLMKAGNPRCSIT